MSDKITAANAPIHMGKVEGHVISRDHQFVIQGPLERREVICLTCEFPPPSWDPYTQAALRHIIRTQSNRCTACGDIRGAKPADDGGFIWKCSGCDFQPRIEVQ